MIKMAVRGIIGILNSPGTEEGTENETNRHSAGASGYSAIIQVF